MSTSDVVGETGELRDQSVQFNAVHTVTGVSGVGSFSLTSANGLSEYIGGHAFVKLIGTSVKVSIRGPVSATIACTVDACVIPDDDDIEKPTTAAQIATVQGNSSAQHSLLVGVQDATLSFANGVSHTFKPSPLVGELPLVCYAYHINGGTTSSTAIIKISGTIEARGIGFVKTW
jgi:hypothetical protein